MRSPAPRGVRADGKRFVIEANGYCGYVAAMIKAPPEGGEVTEWQIADSRFVRKLAWGMAKLLPVPLTSHLRSGYPKRGAALAGLAAARGIDPAGLEARLAEFNDNARRGVDPEFGRGSSECSRQGGDPKDSPKSTLGTPSKGPFYAVAIVPGSFFGTVAGLFADARSRVPRGDGTGTEGLYVAATTRPVSGVGTTRATAFTLGPALTFGYIVARDLAGVTA